MYRYLLALAFTGALAACDTGNPLLSDGAVAQCPQPLQADCETATADDTDTASDTDVAFASDFDADRLRLNAVKYDSTTGELELTNIPHDGDNIYTDHAAGTAALQTTAGSNFQAFTNSTGQMTYYAVFRRSASGYSQVTAVGGSDWRDVGYGGAAAQRLDDQSGAVPTSATGYVFTGEYAAVQTVIDTASTSTRYVTGDATLNVDVKDFQTTGSATGFVNNRRVFDVSGAEVTAVSGVDYISLDRADLNYDTWSIESSSAATIYLTGTNAGSATASGNWQGVFTGPNGEEVAGIVVLDGNAPTGINTTTGDFDEAEVREVGGFVAAR